MIPPEIIVRILEEYTLPLLGVHGVSHWGRVFEIGQRLASQTGADALVVAYFSVFHDARRINEAWDPGHGGRGAKLAESMKSELELTTAQLEELIFACRDHTDGKTDGSVTVQTCWDADRLDLWRVEIRPRRSLLCTPAGRNRDMIRWSESISAKMHVPECSRQWLAMVGSN